MWVVVNDLNLGVDNLESALTALAVLTSCDGLTSRHRLYELREDDTALLVKRRTVHRVPRLSREPKMSDGNR